MPLTEIDYLKSLKRLHLTNVVCVTKQHYVSIFLTRLWSVGTALISGTQNPELLGLLTAHVYKYKTKLQAKLKRKISEKYQFCWLVTSLTLYWKSISMPTDHQQVKKIET